MGHSFIAEIGQPVATGDLIPYDEFLQTRFYNEWVKPQRLADLLTVVLEKTGTSVALFGVFRHERDDARRRMRLIAPHVRRTVLIGRVVDIKTAETSTFADMLDGLGAGLFMVDAAGRIVHANAGHTILRHEDYLRSVGGRLVAHDPQTDQSLRDIFAAAGNGDAALGTKAAHGQR